MEAEKGVVEYEARDGQQVKLSFATIKRFLVQGHPEWVTDQEMVYFMGICRSRALNPFAKDCYLIKYSQKDGAAIITSIDYFRKRAKAQKDCKGWSRGILVERDKEIVYSNGIMLDTDTLLGAWFEAQPEGWEKPYKLEVNLSGYIKKRSDGQVTKFWSKENQPSQIAKVVEAQGLRTVWPDEFQQLYTPEEIGDGDMFKSTENAAPDNLNDKLKGKPQAKAKEGMYDANAASEAEKKEDKKGKKKGAKKKKQEEEKVEEKVDSIRAAYWDLPEPEFTDYAQNNHQAISFLPIKYQDEIYAKWEGFHPGEPFPGSAADEKVEETEEPGDPGQQTQDEKILRLVTGAEFDPGMGQPIIPCRDKKTKVGANWCLQSCEGKDECKPWEKFNAEEEKE